jgi:undecaprenyl-diphosphatase
MTTTATEHAAPFAAQRSMHEFNDADRFQASANLAVGDDSRSARAISCCATAPFGVADDVATEKGFVERVFARLDEHEQPIVQIVMWSCRHPVADSFRVALNWLGNGWIYLMAGVALLLWQGTHGIRPTVAAGCAVGCAFVFYSTIKPLLRRLRPRDSDPLMRLPIEPMDKFSCPSGHCMTAAAVAIPLLLAFPQLHLIIFGLGALIAWSRIACGHHYPSDVLLGIGLGVAVAIPICGLIL